MIVISMLVLALAGLWLVAATIGFVFKLTFALIGGVFSLVGAVFGLFFGALGLLIAAPFVLLALLPVCLPVLLVVGLVWLVARAMRREPVATPSHSV